MMSARQLAMMRELLRYLDAEGVPPTRTELRTALGYGEGVGAVNNMLARLAERGFVRFTRETSRNAFPTTEGRRYVESCAATPEPPLAVMPAKLSHADNCAMVERLLRGEHGFAIADQLGVDRTLPALRAFKWGFITQRLSQVRPDDITAAGRRWLASRPAPPRVRHETDQPRSRRT